MSKIKSNLLNKTDPQISVIMPVYNTKKNYFREAIDSILNQSFTDYELIIIDDCSEEYIQEVTKSYNDKRIKYYRLNKNCGAATARNFAIAKAKGKYLAFMDSDDISLPERLEIQYNYLEKNKDIDCLGTCFDVLKGLVKKTVSKRPRKNKEIIDYLLSNGCVFCQSSVMMRQAVLKKSKVRYKTEFVPAEDYAFWLDLIGKVKFAIIDEVLVVYRSHLNNISHTQNTIQLKKCAEAKILANEKYFKIKLPVFLSDCISKKTFNVSEFNVFEEYIIKEWEKRTLPKLLIEEFFKREFKRKCYHTHSLQLQLKFMFSPLNKIFRLPVYWRLINLLSRGLF